MAMAWTSIAMVYLMQFSHLMRSPLTTSAGCWPSAAPSLGSRSQLGDLTPVRVSEWINCVRNVVEVGVIRDQSTNLNSVGRVIRQC
ncbi:hypothetical protein EV426DRAFT_583801 [Tirmania nivea]|nr:hypothetical protein EV426DRAFT_583801 [Tirmania nivea]